MKNDSLQDVLNLLNEAKKLHESGIYEAHSVAEKARKMLSKIIESQKGLDDFRTDAEVSLGRGSASSTP